MKNLLVRLGPKAPRYYVQIKDWWMRSRMESS